MRDDPLKNLAIVQAVRDVPQLYERETGIPKQELEKLWNLVGSKVELSGIAARDRWRIVRGSYVRYLRSLEGEQKPKKEYYLAKYLEFIRPFLKIGRESLDNSSCVYTVTEMNVEQVQRKTPMKKGVAKRAKAVYPKQEQAVDEYVEVETTKDDEIVYRDELEHSTGDNFQTTFTFPKGEKSSDRDDPLRNLAVVQAVRDIPQLYGREIGIAKEEMERLWNLVGSKADLSGIAARDRWRIVRGSYVRYLRALESEEPPKKEYYLAKYLGFVRPFLKIRGSLNDSIGDYTVTEVPVQEIKRKARPPVTRSPPKRAKVAYQKEEVVEMELERVEEVVVMEEVPVEEEEAEEQEEQELEEQQEVVEEQLEFEPEKDEEQERQIVVQDELENAAGDNFQTYTLRNGELVDSRIKETVIIPSPLAPVAKAASSAAEEETDPDLMFFKSLLPQMTSWTRRQRNKFKVAVLTALDDVEEI